MVLSIICSLVKVCMHAYIYVCTWLSQNFFRVFTDDFCKCVSPDYIIDTISVQYLMNGYYFMFMDTIQTLIVYSLF